MTTYSGSAGSGQQDRAPTNFFAKVFNHGGYQLLVYIDRSDDESEDEDVIALHQMIWLPAGAMLDITLRGREAAIEKVFVRYGQQEAENFFASDMVQKVLETFND